MFGGKLGSLFLFLELPRLFLLLTPLLLLFQLEQHWVIVRVRPQRLGRAHVLLNHSELLEILGLLENGKVKLSHIFCYLEFFLLE